MFQEKPRPNVELLRPLLHGALNIFHYVRHLYDAVVRLAEIEKTHAVTL
jgi:hypothetical protein